MKRIFAVPLMASAATDRASITHGTTQQVAEDLAGADRFE